MTSGIYVTICVIKLTLWKFCFDVEKKKKISKKLDYDVCIVSCDNQDEVPKKTTIGWVRGGFSCVHKQLYVKSPGFYHFSARFRTNFFMALSLWVIRGYQACFPLYPDTKILLLKKHFWFAKFQESKT